jgi:hypothetical protein
MTKPILDQLPVFIITWPCQGCGFDPRKDGDHPGGYNIDKDGNVTNCSLCQERIN